MLNARTDIKKYPDNKEIIFFYPSQYGNIKSVCAGTSLLLVPAQIM